MVGEEVVQLGFRLQIELDARRRQLVKDPIPEGCKAEWCYCRASGQTEGDWSSWTLRIWANAGSC